MFAVEKKAIKN